MLRTLFHGSRARRVALAVAAPAALCWCAIAIAAPATESAAEAKTEKKDDSGFKTLFNGKNLDGWVGATKGYVAEDGLLICKKEGGGNLYTKDEYTDFTFRFDFKLEKNANNGVGLRAPLEGDAAYVGMECQILDDDGDQYTKLAPYQYHGSIYGVLPAKRGSLKKVGEWNSEEITVKGRHVTVVLNGKTIVDGDLDKASTPHTLDHKDHPGLKREKGHIGFLGHGARIEFRNISVKELK
jgi:hypothetical protein